jgi:cyclopropane-fatty-acyl-phospholipid synthase
MRNLNNLNIITKDMNEFSIDEKFDRVVSVEMFEHMRNWNKLLEKVNSFLLPDGKLFIHIFVHQKNPYLFEVKDNTDWMSKYFFTGGMMPSFNLLDHYQEHFKVVQKWPVNGKHYAKTALAWLKNMDNHQEQIFEIFKKTLQN